LKNLARNPRVLVLFSAALVIAAPIFNGIAAAQVSDICAVDCGRPGTAGAGSNDGAAGRDDTGSSNGSDAGQPGQNGASHKGSSSQTGQKILIPAPSSTSKTTSKSSNASSSSSSSPSFTGVLSDGIPVIFLEENDLFSAAPPEFSLMPIETAPPTAEPAKEPARTALKPVRKADGFPLRRTIGILAALVAVGSALSLVSQGRAGRRRGRRAF